MNEWINKIPNSQTMKLPCPLFYPKTMKNLQELSPRRKFSNYSYLHGSWNGLTVCCKKYPLVASSGCDWRPGLFEGDSLGSDAVAIEQENGPNRLNLWKYNAEILKIGIRNRDSKELKHVCVRDLDWGRKGDGSRWDRREFGRETEEERGGEKRREAQSDRHRTEWGVKIFIHCLMR